jgi:hypothetical protein
MAARTDSAAAALFEDFPQRPVLPVDEVEEQKFLTPTSAFYERYADSQY